MIFISDILLRSITGIIAKKMTYPKPNIINKYFKALLRNSGGVTVLLRIFLKILPFLVANPVLITRAIGSPLASNNFDPSNNQQVSLLILSKSGGGNLPIGIFYPVKLASLTYIYPLTSTQSHGTTLLG